MIREFGHENDKLFVAIKEISKKQEVKDFLGKFIQNADSIRIVEFKKMVVKNLAAYVKLGDKVASSRKEEIFGTVGLNLTKENRHYCATCFHVVEDCLKPFRAISTPKDYGKGVIIKTQEKHVEIDKIFTPSLVDLDFSVVRLVGNDIQLSSGLKNQNGDIVDGMILSEDMSLVPRGVTFYKWGAASMLTKGTYIAIREQIGQYPVIMIQTEIGNNFAIGGDSGSLICYSMINCEIAALILKGKTEDGHFVGFKLKDALKLCKDKKPNIKECIRT